MTVMGGDSFYTLGDSTKPFLSGLETERLNLFDVHYLYLIDFPSPKKQTGNKKNASIDLGKHIITCNFPKWGGKRGRKNVFFSSSQGFWYLRPHSCWRALQPAPLTPSQSNSQSCCSFSMRADARTCANTHSSFWQLLFLWHCAWPLTPQNGTSSRYSHRCIVSIGSPNHKSVCRWQPAAKLAQTSFSSSFLLFFSRNTLVLFNHRISQSFCNNSNWPSSFTSRKPNPHSDKHFSLFFFHKEVL